MKPLDDSNLILSLGALVGLLCLLGAFVLAGTA